MTGMHLWRAKYGSFMRSAQTDFATRLIVVPLTTFHRLSEVIGDPQGELIFTFQTGRCGSTLVTQVKQCMIIITIVVNDLTFWVYISGTWGEETRDGLHPNSVW